MLGFVRRLIESLDPLNNMCMKIPTSKSIFKESSDTHIYADTGNIQNRKANLYLENREVGEVVWLEPKRMRRHHRK